jgi:hypothetical protein
MRMTFGWALMVVMVGGLLLGWNAIATNMIGFTAGVVLLEVGGFMIGWVMKEYNEK